MSINTLLKNFVDEKTVDIYFKNLAQQEIDNAKDNSVLKNELISNEKQLLGYKTKQRTS